MTTRTLAAELERILELRRKCDGAEFTLENMAVKGIKMKEVLDFIIAAFVVTEKNGPASEILRILKERDDGTR